MKKFIAALILVVGLFVTTNVSAMTEEQLLAKLSQSYTVNGRTEKLEAGIVKQAKDYLDKYELSSDDCDYIASAIDKGLEIVEAGSATQWKELTSSEVEDLIKLVDDISNNTSVSATLSKNGELVIYNEDGTVFTKVSDLIKYTDSNVAMIVVAGTISLIGLAVIVRKIAKANA